MLYENYETNIFKKALNFFTNNKKYMYIGIGALVAIILLIILILCICLNNKSTKNNLLTATDNSFTIEIPSNISYQINTVENNDFVLDLYSKKDEMFIYGSTILKERMVDFYQIVSDDKEIYLKDKQNIREDSGIIKTTIKDYTAYEYHFIYTDSSYGKDFYSNVVWIETDKNLYILNFEVASDHAEKYQDIFGNIKNSFTEL